MELGQKLRLARREAGLTQRQLCADVITRNMLSQIENGGARPSMQTLQYLAQRLNRPVSWFLQEEGAVSENLQVICRAREAYAAQDWQTCLRELEAYRRPDTLLDPECALLRQEALLSLAEQAAGEGKKPYAQLLLSQAQTAAGEGLYDLQQRRRLLLQLQLQPEQTKIDRLPCLDEELLLRAEAARQAGDLSRSRALLQSMENRQTPRWGVAMGELCLALQDPAAAAEAFAMAEDALPEIALPRLEQCFEALGDYKMAYHYACKQRKAES